MIKRLYGYVGYYNDHADIEYLDGKSADEIVEYFYNVHGNCHQCNRPDCEIDIVLEDEDDKGFLVTSNKGYIVKNDGTFIDLYSLYYIEKNGMYFLPDSYNN